MSEEPEKTESVPSREWIKFIVLAIILVSVILVMAVARPFIFNYVVPVVMGEGQLTAPMTAEEPEETIKEAYPVEKVTPPPVVEEAYPVENDAGSEEEEELPTAVSTISHTVQRGDTMLSIARRYNVTVNAIAAANNISNPNHIEVGMTLLIPQP